MDILIRVLADGLLVVIALMAVYGFMWKVPRHLWVFWSVRIILAGLTAYAAAKIIGHFFQPESLRPFEKLGVQAGAAFLNNPGFPSDHALFATFLTIAVWFSTHHKRLTLAMAVATLLMCAGRVLALVHTPLDVIGGIGIAMISMIWYGQSSEKILQYMKRRGEQNAKRRSSGGNKH